MFKLILYENDVKLLKSKRSLREATSKTHFIFSSKFYNQIDDGIAMGSPLAPVLAKIFMDFHESKWLNEYNLNKSEFYLRYVDDILAVLGFLLQFYRFIYLYIYGILFHSMNKNKEVFIS